MNSRSIIIIFASALLIASCDRSKQPDPEAETPSAPTPPKQQSATAPEETPALAKPVDEPNTPPPSQLPTDPRREAATELVELIGKTPNGRITTAQWKRAIAHYWCPSFDSPIVLAHQLDTAPEARSIKEVLETLSTKKPFALQLTSGEFPDVPDSDEQKTLLALHTLAMTSAMSGGHSLPGALHDRSQNSEPTRGDYFLFEIFSDAYVDIQRKYPIAPVELTDWKRLGESPNPLYRLLALRTFRKVSLDTNQWMDFYASYQTESHPEVLTELIDQLVQTSQPAAVTLLATIETSLTPTASEDIQSHLSKSKNALAAFLKSRGQTP